MGGKTTGLLVFVVLLCVAAGAALAGGISIGTTAPGRLIYQWSGDPRFDYSAYIGSGGVDRVRPGYDETTLETIRRTIGKARLSSRSVFRLGKIGDSRFNSGNVMRSHLDLGLLADSTGYGASAWNTFFIDADSSFYNATTGSLEGPSRGNQSGWRLADAVTNNAVDSVRINVNPAVVFWLIGINDIGAGSHNPADTCAFRDSLVVQFERCKSDSMLPIGCTLTPSAFTSQGSVFNGGSHLSYNRMIRQACDIANVPCLDLFHVFMDTGARLRAARPAEFPTDSLAIFGPGAVNDSCLVDSDDKVHWSAAYNVTDGPATNGRTCSTQALTQKSGVALASVAMFQAVMSIVQAGERRD